MRALATFVLAGICLPLVADERAAAEDDLPAKARTLLEAKCARCHGRDSTVKGGGFDFVLDRERLVTLGKVTPGKSAESELFQMIDAGKMPPAKSKIQVTPEEKAALARWIDGGAPPFQAAASGPLLAEADVLRLIRTDLDKLTPRSRKFVRYFTLAHLAAAGVPEDDLKTCRLGLAKLLNSLSWHPRLAALTAVDPAASILRIDLRDLKWNLRLWDRLVGLYPYRVGSTGPDARAVAAASGTEQAHVRADWFLANASRPPLYYDLLQMPNTDRGLEGLLQVDAAAEIEAEAVVRAGFNGSGVSKNNRLLERHDGAFGAYWKTYDFSDNRDRQNLFDHPLGPPPARNSFVHAGGEMIGHLPNGLFVYLLVNGIGNRVDRAPTEIVSDPRRPDRAVEAGLSCFSCHAGGFLPKADQVRAHVQKNLRAFGREDAEAILALYPTDEKVTKLLDSDNRRYRAALTGVGLTHEMADPINAAVERYEAVVTLANAAAEAGLTPTEFARRLGAAPDLNRPLGALRVKGGTVQRQTFETAFPDLVRIFGLADAAPTAAEPAEPFVGHTGVVHAVALSADGKRALSGGDDGSVRLWDADTGRERACFNGHRSAVRAVALSADGRWALSGGDDRTVRLWDATDGREVQRLTGHTDRVSCVAFAPDLTRAVSGGDDRTLRVWDLDVGEEIASLAGHTGRVNCLAVGPDARFVCSGGKDGSVRLWDLNEGGQTHCFEDSAGEITAVAFDGRFILAGSADRKIRLWHRDRITPRWSVEERDSSVVALGFTRASKEFVFAVRPSVESEPVFRLRETAAAKEIRRFESGPVGAVRAAAFSADGRRALLAGTEPALKLWRLDP